MHPCSMETVELGPPSTAVRQGVPSTASPRWTLVATSFGLGMALLDVTAGNVAVPSIQRDFGTGIAGISWVIDGYTLAFASTLLLAGGLGDRLGARRVFASGLVLFTVASLLCGVAPTAGLLIGARVLQGLGAALFMPSSLALLARAYPDARERAHAIGFWSAPRSPAGAVRWWAAC
ncbi:MAG: MFS transporter [Myxococcaceae bacterium]|nr:MAG: MFS transporter [Myxococcaceae bacterium]